MAQKHLFTSPMARKKRVIEKYSLNSYRVISTDAENWMKPVFSTSTTIADQNLIGQPADPNRPSREFRSNRPNANHVGFLRQNVKFLNEPLCDVHSADTASEQYQWWPHRTAKGIEKKPEHTLDTTVRNDYQWRSSPPSGNTRHSANPNKRPVWGSVPVNFLRDPSGRQRLLKEGISYEHQYDARENPSYPPRGRRHGAFVWDQFSNDHAERLLKQCDYSFPCDGAKTNGVPNNNNDPEKETESRSEVIKQVSKDASEQITTTLPPICT